MSSDVKKNGKSWGMKMAIAFIIYAIFQFILPAPEPITKAGMGVVGIFLATVYLWITVGIGWPSLLMVGMIGTTGVCTASELFAKTWGNSMTAFLVACFLLNGAMGETGLTRRFAMWFITRKSCAGKPWKIMFMFFFSCLLIGLVSTSSAITILYMAIAEEILSMTGYKKGEELPKAMMLGIFIMAEGAMFMTPISHVLIPNVFGWIEEGFGVTVSYGQFSAIFMLCGLIWFIAFWLIFRYLMKPDVSGLVSLDLDKLKKSVPAVSLQEKIVGLVYGIVIIIWLCPGLVKMIGLTTVGTWMSKLGTAIPAVIGAAVLCAVHVDGKPIIDLPAANRKIGWNSVYMMTAVMGTAYIFGLESCGVTAWLGQAFAPIMENMNPTMFVLAAIIFELVMTNCVSNTLSCSMYNVLIPLAMSVSGVNPIALGLIIASACYVAFGMPSACPAASLHGDWTPVGYQMKWGWLSAAISVPIFMCVAYPLCCMMFPYAG